MLNKLDVCSKDLDAMTDEQKERVTRFVEQFSPEPSALNAASSACNIVATVDVDSSAGSEQGAEPTSDNELSPSIAAAARAEAQGARRVLFDWSKQHVMLYGNSHCDNVVKDA